MICSASEEVIFSNDFFQATYWPNSEIGRRIRSETFPPLTEQVWTAEVNTFLRKHFDLEQDLPSVFLDSHYDPTDEEEKKGCIAESQRLDSLVMSLEEKGRFPLQDIKAVRSQLTTLHHKLSKKKKTAHLLNARIDELSKGNKWLSQTKAELLDANSALQKDLLECRLYRQKYRHTTRDLYLAGIGGFTAAGKSFYYMSIHYKSSTVFETELPLALRQTRVCRSGPYDKQGQARTIRTHYLPTQSAPRILQ